MRNVEDHLAHGICRGILTRRRRQLGRKQIPEVGEADVFPSLSHSLREVRRHAEKVIALQIHDDAGLVVVKRGERAALKHVHPASLL